jgi:hypothetical protein
MRRQQLRMEFAGRSAEQRLFSRECTAQITERIVGRLGCVTTEMRL